ncbi:hypothetical protein [Streptomyces sp. NPDC056660]|uniref:hypothetical protein n=1 Tax=Streptomyces sp. NPDC056660 TaxID=3345897 RepID=UPI003686B241
MTVLPDPEHRQLVRSAPTCYPNERGACLIESEIVIVDDDGTEEPFDPSSSFE